MRWRVNSSGFRVRVPASSANLGPGFDSIGLALELYLHATIAPAAAFSLTFEPGPWAPTNANFEAEIVRGIGTAAGPGDLPPVAISVRNGIPLGKGLGASAAGAVLGLIIASELLAAPPDEAALARQACAIEGHPDNALPALLGGVVIAAQAEDGTPSFVRLEPPDLTAVAVVPQIVLPTAAARALLPERYERRDAVYNIQRAALLAAALAAKRYDLLRIASADRIHQPYRAPLVPGFSEMLALELPGLRSVALSGAGPSVLALVERDPEIAAAALQACFTREGLASTTFVLRISAAGAVVER